MGTVYVFLADGFEEMEAVCPVDMLRRAEVKVVTVGVTGRTVTGSRSIPVVADVDGESFTLPEDAAMVVLPGGGGGAKHLAESAMVAEMLAEASRRDLFIAAICAAPTVLYKAGLLKGKRATAFPTVQGQLAGIEVTGRAVEVDGRIITGRSAGVAQKFGHALIAALCGGEKADAVMTNLFPGD